MSNRHIFNTTLKDDYTSHSHLKEQQTFTSYLYSSRIFSGIISGFQASTTWIAKIQQSIKIEISRLSQLIKFSAPINFGNIKVELKEMLSTIKLSQTIYQTIKIEAMMSMAKKMGDLLITLPMKLECKLKDFVYGRAYLVNTTIKVEVVPTVRKYTLLNFYDSDLLSDWDSSLLSDMEFTIV
jgi:hypothetical protein